MKTLIVALITIVALTAPARAELKCFEDSTAVVDALINKAGEYLIKAYKVDETSRLEFHVSEKGTWTALLMLEENITCILGFGTDLNVNKKDLAIIRIHSGFRI